VEGVITALKEQWTAINIHARQVHTSATTTTTLKLRSACHVLLERHASKERQHLLTVLLATIDLQGLSTQSSTHALQVPTVLQLTLLAIVHAQIVRRVNSALKDQQLHKTAQLERSMINTGHSREDLEASRPASPALEVTNVRALVQLHP
jgi:hypothetical protein